MLNNRKTCLSACFLFMACLILSGASALGGDKKSEDKKKETPKASGPLLAKSGELKKDDEKDTRSDLKNSPRKTYSVTLTEGKTYQLDLKSKDFDAYLRLEDAKGKEVAFNDDANEDTFDSRIVYKAPKTGDYKIIVTSFDGKAGNFALSVVEADPKAVISIGSKFKGKAIELYLKGGKTAYAGELNEQDPTAFKHFYKLFTIELEQGKLYQIDCRNTGKDPKFDPHLYLEDEGERRLADDDDGGDDLNARLIFRATRTGIYRIIATTNPQLQTGRFTLAIGPAAEPKKEKK